MGLLHSLKKKIGSQKVSVVMSANEPTLKEIEEQQTQNAKRKVKNALKDEAGLYPYEILLLSYYEKYVSGKPIARFWQYEFGIDNVPKLMKSLEARGFADGEKLTPLGLSEVEKSDYISYIRNHKYLNISVTDLSILVNQNPGENYRDLIWGELNRRATEAFQRSAWGLYRNAKYSMYRMLMDEKQYPNALPILFEVIFYDLNSRDVYPIPPAVIKDIRELSMRLDMPYEQMDGILQKHGDKLYAPTHNFTSNQVVSVFVAYAYGHDDIAEKIINTKIV